MTSSNGSGSSGALSGSAAVMSPGFTRARTGYLSECSRYSAIQSTSAWPWRRNASASIALSRMRLRVGDGELLQRRAGHAERLRFLRRAIGIPVIDDQPFDHPHCRGTIACRAVNVRRRVAGRGDRVEELVGNRRIRLLSVERDVVEADVSGLRGRGFGIDIRALLGRQPQVDDRCEPELLDLGDGFRLRRAAARDGCLEPGEVRRAGNVLPGDLLRARRARADDGGDDEEERMANHGLSSLKALNHIANRVCFRPLVLSLSKDEPECSPGRSWFDTLTTSGRSKGSYERVGVR